MFQRRRRSLKRALEEAGDDELRLLRAEVSRRQERVAQLEFELSDTRADLARFEQELDRRLGPLQRRQAQLEQQLEEARRKAARRAQWGERLDAEEPPIDVEEQFRRTWSQRPKEAEPPQEQPVPEELKAEMRSLFRSLAKRFHPDLVTDSNEKRWRVKMMAEVNEAYASQNLAALRKLAERPDRLEEPRQKTREQLIAELRGEIFRLDRVIQSLERKLQELINSHTVQLMLEVTIAARSGRDLLEEMAKELRAEIARLEVDLAALQ